MTAGAGRSAAHVAAIVAPGGEPVGAGLRLDDGRVVTCAHVVRAACGDDVEPGASVRVRSPDPDGWSAVATLVEIADAGSAGKLQDVALLRLAPDDAPPLGALRPAAWRPGQRVQMLGFPDGHPAGALTHGRLAQARGDGAVQYVGRAEPGVAVTPGFSGAPVWAEVDGALLGVLTAYDAAPETNVAFVIPAERLPLSEAAAKTGALTQGLPGPPRTQLEGFLAEQAGSGPGGLPFGGRAQALAALDAWLGSPSQRALLVAPAGRGKSALVARWATALAERADVALAPVNQLHGTASRRDALQLLGERLAHLVGRPLAGEDPDGWKETIDAALRGDAPGGRPLVVVIDGADEADGWSLETDRIVPPQLGARVKVLVTARPEARRDAGGWLKLLGWSPDDATTIELPPLDADGVRDVVARLPAEVVPASRRELAVRELTRLSDGDPLVLSLQLQQLVDGTVPSVERLGELPPGLGPLLLRCLDRAPDQQVRDGSHALLGLLASARGPLRRAELVELGAPELRPAALGACLHELRRLVVGDDAVRGFALGHPRIGETFRADYMSADERRARDERFRARGLAVLDALDAGEGAQDVERDPLERYAVEHLGAHLADAPDGYEQLTRLVGRAWLRAWDGQPAGVTGFLDDVRRVRDAARARGDRAQELRCVLVQTSVAAFAGNVPGELLRALVTSGRWTFAQALAHVRLVPEGDARGPLLAEIADLAPDALLEELTAMARAINDVPGRAVALVAVSQRSGDAALGAEANELLDDFPVMERCADQLAHLVEHARDAPGLVAAIVGRAFGECAVTAAATLAGRLEDAQRAELARRAEDVGAREASARLADRARAAELWTLYEKAADELPGTDLAPFKDLVARDTAPVVARLFDKLDAPQRASALQRLAEAVRLDRWWTALAFDGPLSPPEAETLAVQARRQPDLQDRVGALATIAAKVQDPSARDALIAEARDAVPDCPDDVNWPFALLRLVDAGAPDRAALLHLAYRSAARYREDEPMAHMRLLLASGALQAPEAVAWLAPYVDELAPGDDLLALTRTIGDETVRCELVAAVLQALEPSARAPLAALVRHAAEQVRVVSREVVLDSSGSSFPRARDSAARDGGLALRTRLLAPLLAAEAGAGREEALGRLLDAIDGEPDDELRIRALAILRRFVEGDERQPVADRLWRLAARRGEESYGSRELVLAAGGSDASAQRRVLEDALAIEHPPASVATLAAIVVAADGDVRRDAWRALLARAEAAGRQFGRAVAGAWPHVPDELRAELKPLLQAPPIATSQRAVAALAHACPDPWLPTVAAGALALAPAPRTVEARLTLASRLPAQRTELVEAAYTAASQLLPGGDEPVSSSELDVDEQLWHSDDVRWLLAVVAEVDAGRGDALLRRALLLADELAHKRLGVVGAERVCALLVETARHGRGRDAYERVRTLPESLGVMALLAISPYADEPARWQRIAFEYDPGAVAEWDPFRRQNLNKQAGAAIEALAADGRLDAAASWAAMQPLLPSLRRPDALELLSSVVPLLRALGAPFLRRAIEDLIELGEWLP